MRVASFFRGTAAPCSHGKCPSEKAEGALRMMEMGRRVLGYERNNQNSQRKTGGL